MKKICAILLLMIFVCISGCKNECEGLKTIEVPEVGSIKIPKTWQCCRENEFIYFYDEKLSNEFEKAKPLIVGVVTDDGKDIEKISDYYGEKIIYVDLVKSQVFSNNAIVSKTIFNIENDKCEKASVWIGSEHKSAYFIVLDEKIEYEEVLKIGESFRMHLE